MRGLAVLLAVAGAWLVSGAPVPAVARPRLRLPRLDPVAVALGAATALVTFALALGVTAAPAIAASIALLAGAGPLAAAAARRARQRAAVVEQWPDLLAVLRSHLTAGAALPESFVAAGRRAGGELAEAAERVERAIAVTGDVFPTALHELREELADPVSDRVLTTLAEAHRAGGHRVGSVLGSLAASVADELRLRKAHDAALTQQRLTATVALVAPWVLLVLTVTTNPQASEVYRTTEGVTVVAVGLAATLGGYALARRVARLSRPPRLFG